MKYFCNENFIFSKPFHFQEIVFEKHEETLVGFIFSYYKLEEIDHLSINKYLSYLVEKSLVELENCYCLEIAEVSLVITCM